MLFFMVLFIFNIWNPKKALAMSKVFVSYRYQDKEAKATVNNWLKQGLGEDISFADLDEAKFESDSELKRGIREKISKCQKILVLVGQNTHNSKWVQYEILQGQEAKPAKGILWTQLPNTTGGCPPQLKKIHPTPFSMNMIQRIIREA
jgi:hypothetical protein